MHKWGVRVGEEVFLARVRGESVGEVFPARAASDQSLQPGPKPGLSLTLIYLRTNNIKKNILRSLGRTDVTAQMAKGAAERWDGEEAGGSGLQRLQCPPPHAESALVRCSVPGFRKRGFVPKVLYPEIS